MNQIYQDHLNDELNSLLKPIVEELIPYYKSLMSSNRILKLTYEISNRYQNFATKIDYQIHNGFCIIPIYLNYLISFILDPPGDAYNELLKKLIIFFQINTSSFLHERPQYPKSLEIVNELITLKQQKYYIVWYLIDYLNQASKDSELRWDDICLILSLLPWKVNADCKEARDLEEDLSGIVQKGLKKYNYDVNISYSLTKFAKFIINTINKSEQHLDPNDLKQKLEGMKNVESEGGCCIIQ